MKFDTVIVGGGLSGLVCGIRLAEAGCRCAIVSSGQSALHFSSGSFDLLNALPDGTPVGEPAAAVEALCGMAPDHPYARLGGADFVRLAGDAAALLRASGVAVAGDAAANHYRVTPMGTLRPTWLTLPGYVRSMDPQRLPWRRAAVFEPAGFLDFYARFIAGEFARAGTECTVRTFSLPALEALRRNPSEMRSAHIARLFDAEEHLDALAGIVRREAGDCEAVLLPAVIGLMRDDAFEALARRVDRPVYQVATMGPSVPGIRTQLRLRRRFEAAGGVYFLGDTVLRGEFRSGGVVKLYTNNHADIPFEAETFVLATGSYFSRGLVASATGVSEPVFGLDVVCDADRGTWYDRNFFGRQRYLSFGVKSDAGFRASKGGRPLANLYVIGAGLAGFDPVATGCGAGVSLLTALGAAERILSE